MRDKELHTRTDIYEILLQDEMEVWDAIFIVHLFQELRDSKHFFFIMFFK
jgi:hypothetical protein